MKRSGQRWLLTLLLLLIAGSAEAKKVKEPKVEPATLKVSGFGLISDRKLKGLLKVLNAEHEPEFFDANFVEDCVVVIQSELERRGFLKPEIFARVQLENGDKASYHWNETLNDTLPNHLKARRVHFRIKEGVRFHYRKIRLEGLEIMDENDALGYFVNTHGLLKLAANRVYTPRKAQFSARSLQEALQREGYQNATVWITNVVRNDTRGKVDLTVAAFPGKRFMVRSVRVEELHPTLTNELRTINVLTNQPYSRLWLQDFEQGLVRRQYREGFPDAAATIGILRSNVSDQVSLDLVAQVRPGRRARVDDIRFVGEDKTRESVMRARIPLKEGELLDRTKAEQGRFRLARLGIFETVDMRYQTENDQERDIVYEVKEGKRLEVTLLAGFGSYELLRGGLILDQRNVWGSAHNSRLKLVQSFKSSSVDYTYTIPQLRWSSDVFFAADALRREEVDFTREEVSAGVGARRSFVPIYTDATVRYSYEYLNVPDADFVRGFGVPNARVGAGIIDLRHDMRDSPISPRKGHKLFSTVEVASSALGGEVDYERVELHGSFHLPISRDRWIHLGASHGVLLTSGDSADLPFNKRFFPGGESSIRGYQEGDASPKNPAGKVVGAESYLGGNIELEQALTPSWSIVGFFDVMGVTADSREYPYDELLYSAGGGVRWNTIIGPVRLEYGYNLNRRKDDPAGTLHLSIGFPF